MKNKYAKRLPLSSAVKNSVNEELEKGRLFRYDTTANELSQVAIYEQEFAKLVGHTYAIALNSCSSAIDLALRSLGVTWGTKVLIPAFTFVAVPSAIARLGGIPVLVEVTDDLYIDTKDLAKKISDDTKILLLSHMRGQVPNMDEVQDLCSKNGIAIVEDCAHSLGMKWKGKCLGSAAKAACFSSQSYKMLDSGEGGILTTNDPELAAKAIIYSGSYETYWQTHGTVPPIELMQKYQQKLPCLNFRMSNLTAAALRPQLKELSRKVSKLQANYALLAEQLSTIPEIYIPKRPEGLEIAPDSIQFKLLNTSHEAKESFFEYCVNQHLHIQNFNKTNARCFWNWKFIEIANNECPYTKELLEYVFDIRLPYVLEKEDIIEIADIIADAVANSKKIAA